MVYSIIFRPDLNTRRFLKKIYLVFSFVVFYMAVLAGLPLASKQQTAMLKNSRNFVVSEGKITSDNGDGFNRNDFKKIR